MSEEQEMVTVVLRTPAGNKDGPFDAVETWDWSELVGPGTEFVDLAAPHGKIPLPGQTVAGHLVMASVLYSDVPLAELGYEPRFEVLLLRLMPEPPYFEVGVWDLRGEPVPAHVASVEHLERHMNIVHAIQSYEENGGDV